MLTEAERSQAADTLMEAERTGRQTSQLSRAFPGLEIEDSYAIQSEVARRKLAAGQRLIGHKVGLTSKAMRHSVQIDEPDYGHLLDTMMVEDGSKVAHGAYCVPRIEPELAFILGAELRGPGVTLQDVLRATEYVIPALEIIDARIQDPRIITDTVADNGAAAGIILGRCLLEPHETDLRWVSAVLYRNAEIEETGVAAGVLGHPALGVAWLANKLARFGTPLLAGHIVLSGSFTRPVRAEVGDTIRGDFGPLGSVCVQFV